MTTTTTDQSGMGTATPDGKEQRGRGSFLLPAIAGILAAGLALGVGELVAGLVPAGRSLVVAVGALVIRLVPEPVKELGIALFGTNDKIALIAGTMILLAFVAAAVGVGAARRRWVGDAGVAAFGALGLVASLSTAFEGGLVAVAAPAVLGTVAGIVALRWLSSTLGGRAADAPPATASPAPAPSADVATAGSTALQRPTGTVDRRRFLQVAGAVAVVAAGAASVGRLLQRSASVASERSQLALGRVRDALAPPPASATPDVEGITPFLTSNADFYRIDTALSVPKVDVASWSMSVTGMVEQDIELTFDDLRSMELVERYVTLSCVSNEVGGGLISTAKFLGVPLSDVLDRARPTQREGLQVLGVSVDDFTAGFPIEAAYDGRDALIAIGMNDEPLPLEHGFPARLVVPGLYGYVSATKWLSRIELTTFDDVQAYWEQRGWAQKAPVKTQSRIDVPRGFQTYQPGEVAFGGVAWAMIDGVEGVEVQLDDGPWQEATLADDVGVSTWRLWSLRTEVTQPGTHRLTVRATDGTGETQPEERQKPYPSGATGWHTVSFTVAEPSA